MSEGIHLDYHLMGCGGWYLEKYEVNFDGVGICLRVTIDMSILSHLTKGERRRININPISLDFNVKKNRGIVKFYSKNVIAVRTLSEVKSRHFSIDPWQIKAGGIIFHPKGFSFDIIDTKLLDNILTPH